MSILTKNLSNFSKPHSNIKSLFSNFELSVKFRPNVGGFSDKLICLKFFHNKTLNETCLV